MKYAILILSLVMIGCKETDQKVNMAASPDSPAIVQPEEQIDPNVQFVQNLDGLWNPTKVPEITERTYCELLVYQTEQGPVTEWRCNADVVETGCGRDGKPYGGGIDFDNQTVNLSGAMTDYQGVAYDNGELHLSPSGRTLGIEMLDSQTAIVTFAEGCSMKYYWNGINK